MKHKSRIGAALTATAIGVTLASVGISPANAAGSYCTEGTTHTKSATFSVGDRAKTTLKETMKYIPLYSCGGTKVGVKITGASASYSGGYHSSTHGITYFGIDMFRASDGSGSEVAKGSIKHLSTAVRSVSKTYSYDIFAGVYGVDKLKYAFDDVSVFAYYDKPDDSYAQDSEYNAWLRGNANNVYVIGDEEADPGPLPGQ